MLRSGDVLHGRYRVERILGSGGMGGVYLASHLELEVPVAVKELVIKLPDPTEHASVVRQFRSEAQMLYRLHHPHLPRVYDFFEDAGSHFLVMDYVDGHTLEEEMHAGGPFSEDQVRQVATELLDVLAYMHAQKPPVIFRDLKPANIMVDSTGQIKLIDFGIAKLIEDGSSKTHTIIRAAGTPGFAAPEQYGAGTDERSDIYSLGATLYCLLTADVPPPSPALAVDAAHLPPLADARPDLSSQMLSAIARMMETAPARRPKSMREVQGLLAGTPTVSLPSFDDASTTTRVDPPFPPPPPRSEPQSMPLSGLRLSGDTQDLAGNSRLGLRYGGEGAMPAFSGFVGDSLSSGTEHPRWSQQAEKVLDTAVFHRQEAVHDSTVHGPVSRDSQAARIRPPDAEPPRNLGPLPVEVTVPVLVGMLAAIVFLVVLAAFLRAHPRTPDADHTMGGPRYQMAASPEKRVVISSVPRSRPLAV